MKKSESTITIENGAYTCTMPVKELARKQWKKSEEKGVVKWRAELGDGHALTIVRLDIGNGERMWRVGIDGDTAVTERRRQHWRTCVRYAGNALARALADDDDYLDLPVLRLAEALGLYEIDRQDALALIMDGADVKDRLLLPYYAHTNWWGDKRRAGVVRLQDLQHADWVPEKVDYNGADLGLSADFVLANREHIRVIVWKDTNGKPFVEIQNGSYNDIHPLLMHARRHGRKYVSLDIGEIAIPAVRLAGACKPLEADIHAEQESARLFWRAFID